MKPVELLERLVATASVSGDESRIADFVARHARGFGAVVERSDNNIWFSLGRGDGPTLLFNSHLDTVPACAGWTLDPMKPAWRGSRLYGLGSNDAKASVAAMLSVAECLAGMQERIPGRVVFALTAEEEIGGQKGIASVLDMLGPVNAAIVGEPTSLEACTAQRGMLILKCVSHGVSGHVAHSRPSTYADASVDREGRSHGGSVNAIEVAARDVTRLAQWEFEPHELLGQTRAQVTQIQGGLQRNQIPDRCEFFVDLRTTPNLDHSSVAAEIDAALESEVTIHSARYLPKHTDSGHPLVRAALTANGRDTPVGSNTTSDWAFLGDLPVVKLGPGDTQRSHRPDEYLEAEELAAGIRVYSQITRQFFEVVSA